MDENQTYGFFEEYAIANTLNKGKIIMRQILMSNINATSFGLNVFKNKNIEEGLPLQEFPEIVCNLSTADPKILKELYKLLYPKSKVDENEVVPLQKILEFSGFYNSDNSNEFFIRELLIANMPSDTLRGIKRILCIPDTPLTGFGQKKLVTSADLLCFIKKPTKYFFAFKKNIYRNSPKISKQKDEQNNLNLAVRKLNFHNTLQYDTLSPYESSTVISPTPVNPPLYRPVITLKSKSPLSKKNSAKKRKSDKEGNFYEVESKSNSINVKIKMFSNEKSHGKTDLDTDLRSCKEKSKPFFNPDVDYTRINENHKTNEKYEPLHCNNGKTIRHSELNESNFLNGTENVKLKNYNTLAKESNYTFIDKKSNKIENCHVMHSKKHDSVFDDSIKNNKINKYCAKFKDQPGSFVYCFTTRNENSCKVRIKEIRAISFSSVENNDVNNSSTKMKSNGNYISLHNNAKNERDEDDIIKETLRSILDKVTNNEKDGYSAPVEEHYSSVCSFIKKRENENQLHLNTHKIKVDNLLEKYMSSEKTANILSSRVKIYHTIKQKSASGDSVKLFKPYINNGDK